MSTEKRYLVIGGEVFAADGDVHYIDAMTLCRLYGVDPRDAVLAEHEGTPPGVREENYIVLRPRDNGDYRLPE
jgi:hypothetical protein